LTTWMPYSVSMPQTLGMAMRATLPSAPPEWTPPRGPFGPQRYWPVPTRSIERPPVVSSRSLISVRM
jgi:hypothetical protein